MIKEAAKTNGYVPLFDIGLQKVEAGTICLAELLKETSNSDDPFSSYQRVSEESFHANTI